MTETPEQIAARYGAVCRPGLRVTVCPPYATTDEAWHPAPAKEQYRRDMARRALGRRLAALAPAPEPKPVEQLVVVKAAPKPPQPVKAAKPKMARKLTQRAPKPPKEPRINGKYMRDRARRDAALPVIRRMVAEGKADREIALVLGVRRETVREWRGFFGIEAARPLVIPNVDEANEFIAANADDICQLHAAGLSDTEIGRIFGGRSNQQIARARRKLGLAPNPRRKRSDFIPPEIEARLRAAEQGFADPCPPDHRHLCER